jgi:MYXO-CTERM domain-containing protein
MKVKMAKPVLGFVLLSGTLLHGGQITPTGIAVWPNQRFSNDTPPNAIDGNLATATWSTESNNTLEASLGLDFGGLVDLDFIRLYKDPNGGGGPNIKNLVIEYTDSSSALALSARIWQAVPNLTNGIYGQELMTATSVNPDGTVIGDVHNSFVSGFASLSFDHVEATGVRVRFDSGGGFNHYRVHEFEAYSVPEPATALAGLIAVAALAVARRRQARS